MKFLTFCFTNIKKNKFISMIKRRSWFSFFLVFLCLFFFLITFKVLKINNETQYFVKKSYFVPKNLHKKVQKKDLKKFIKKINALNPSKSEYNNLFNELQISEIKIEDKIYVVNDLWEIDFSKLSFKDDEIWYLNKPFSQSGTEIQNKKLLDLIKSKKNPDGIQNLIKKFEENATDLIRNFKVKVEDLKDKLRESSINQFFVFNDVISPFSFRLKKIVDFDWTQKNISINKYQDLANAARNPNRSENVLWILKKIHNFVNNKLKIGKIQKIVKLNEKVNSLIAELKTSEALQKIQKMLWFNLNKIKIDDKEIINIQNLKNIFLWLDDIKNEDNGDNNMKGINFLDLNKKYFSVQEFFSLAKNNFNLETINKCLKLKYLEVKTLFKKFQNSEDFILWSNDKNPELIPKKIFINGVEYDITFWENINKKSKIDFSNIKDVTKDKISLFVKNKISFAQIIKAFYFHKIFLMIESGPTRATPLNDDSGMPPPISTFDYISYKKLLLKIKSWKIKEIKIKQKKYQVDKIVEILDVEQFEKSEQLQNLSLNARLQFESLIMDQIKFQEIKDGVDFQINRMIKPLLKKFKKLENQNIIKKMKIIDCGSIPVTENKSFEVNYLKNFNFTKIKDLSWKNYSEQKLNEFKQLKSQNTKKKSLFLKLDKELVFLIKNGISFEKIKKSLNNLFLFELIYKLQDQKTKKEVLDKLIALKLQKIKIKNKNYDINFLKTFDFNKFSVKDSQDKCLFLKEWRKKYEKIADVNFKKQILDLVNSNITVSQIKEAIESFETNVSWFKVLKTWAEFQNLKFSKYNIFAKDLNALTNYKELSSKKDSKFKPLLNFVKKLTFAWFDNEKIDEINRKAIIFFKAITNNPENLNAFMILKNFAKTKITIGQKNYDILNLRNFMNNLNKNKNKQSILNWNVVEEIFVLIKDNITIKQIQKAINLEIDLMFNESVQYLINEFSKPSIKTNVWQKIQNLNIKKIVINNKGYNVKNLQKIKLISQKKIKNNPEIKTEIFALAKDFITVKQIESFLKNLERERFDILLANFKEKNSILDRLRKLNKTKIKIDGQIFYFQKLLKLNWKKKNFNIQKVSPDAKTELTKLYAVVNKKDQVKKIVFALNKTDKKTETDVSLNIIFIFIFSFIFFFLFSFLFKKQKSIKRTI